jgi:tetratricopeptide (TPR) repeat protein
VTFAERWTWARRPASLALLAAVTVAAFAGVLRNGWILYDDPDYVTANPHISGGLTLEGLRWVLHSPHGGNFHPLTSAVHMLAAQAFGLHAGAHHALSLLLHVMSAVLLALALNRLTRSWWKSLFVAALFAVHPLRVESVAWVSELKDVLSGFCFMLVLWTYARWAERPGRGRYALVVACLALGLMSKPMLVTLPFVLVLLDVWPLGRLRGLPLRAPSAGAACGAPARGLPGLFAEKWPMFLLVLAQAAVTFFVQRATGAVVGGESLAWDYRVLNAALSYWRYLGLTFWPHDLVPFYPMHFDLGGRGALAAAALVGVTALALWAGRARPHLAVGWLWYVGTLLPVIGLVQVGMQACADRYTYLPVIGFLIAAVWTADEFWPRGRPARIAAAVVACALVVAGGVGTARQVERWRDNRTLFGYTLGIDPTNPAAHQCVGSELLAAGRTGAAVKHFEEVLRVAPGYTDARLNLAGILAKQGRLDEAIAQLREVLRTRDVAKVRVNLGSTLAARGKYEEALTNFRLALRTENSALIHHNIARTLMRLGRVDEAIAEYETALRLEPDDLRSLTEMAAALGQQGRLGAAADVLQRVVKLHPKDDASRRLLAVTLTRAGRVEEAISEYRVLVRKDSCDLDALNNIAWIRATHADPRRRNGAEAVGLAEQARDRLRAAVAVLFSTLAAAYAEAGRFPDAVRAGGRAVELARAERDTGAATRFAGQLACYRSGRPFHFAR